MQVPLRFSTVKCITSTYFCTFFVGYTEPSVGQSGISWFLRKQGFEQAAIDRVRPWMCKRLWCTWNCYNFANWCTTCSWSGTAKVHRSPNSASGWRLLTVIADITNNWYVIPSSLRPSMLTRTSWFGNNRRNHISTMFHGITLTAFGRQRIL